MNKKWKYFLSAACLLFLSGSMYHLKSEIDSSFDYIYHLESEVSDLESRVVELERLIKDKKDSYSYNQSKLEILQQENDLLEQELNFHNIRYYKTDVFYEAIKKSKFEDFITNQAYFNPNNPKLTKVSVNITGTENVIDFLMHLTSKYEYSYIKEYLHL